ncbi:molybdopterin molybdenumtransferase MoeA [Paraoerskovia sediminicola]|uniref:Molybdopterin molybdenumtransferase n=1 Tax=Paraoerskovia sediminicola TaxID=1138587 RepID=A0ABN6XC24_9CELL|nr:gephyrin-like molybdotransferase Glp [Paraoerskovia sediminicola]BDZ42402.1 molybdopterin molybdenumtransferase MoeA [Paraoerskovia sediminicola]
MQPVSRSVDEHRASVLAAVGPTPVVDVPLEDSVGMVLGGPLVARADVPPFDNAAMDGYAVRTADVADATPEDPCVLRLVGDVSAGRTDPSSAAPVVTPGTAVRIMTGAPVPDGADAVVPVERTDTGRFEHGPLDGADTSVTVRSPGRGHVRHRAEDLTVGDTLAPAGTLVTSRVASVAASVGLASLPVHRRPRVVVISTGSELAADGAPGPGRIPDSNSYLLAASARNAGAEVVRRGAVPDTVDALRAVLDAAAGATPADLIITSGGVSAGAMDVVRHLLTTADEATGATVAAVGMQPGKPQVLASWREVPVVAVPGNPVAAFVSFEMFVRPALRRLRGEPDVAPPTVERVAGSGWSSPPGRLQVVPVVHEPGGAVRPAGRRDGRGSGAHRVSALVTADALALIDPDVDEVCPGDTVRVLLLGG